MQKISKKSREKLFNEVHEEIMIARIKIAKLTLDYKGLGRDVDNILSDLSINCPTIAINCFKTSEK